MPLPFIIGGIAVAAGAYGAKKGYDASEKNEKAERIVDSAERRFNRAKRELREKQEETNFICCCHSKRVSISRDSNFIK
ncbi:hypothetical protein MNB_SV-15-1547 [hydrothermal vent metagenome]|uniref:Uncharacterized protein n=1 Tax=hydrothermal vent metagenome TaxID=652676 RepID=A0A1W1EJY4_9ZZZZ